MEVLKRVKALGVRVAMDDFGAGYSGLASLAHFPFDKIKIDRSFVGQLTEDADVAAIVAAIVALGRTLSVDVTAEGVETSEQVTLLEGGRLQHRAGLPVRRPEARSDGAHRAVRARAKMQQRRRREQPAADPLELSARRSWTAKDRAVSQRTGVDKRGGAGAL